jgi:uncharacterized protein YndB with AHSA1/START domain
MKEEAAMATTTKTQVTAEPGTPFVDVVREFEAPRDLVFRAWTDPELMTQWLGGSQYTMRVDKWNVGDGGSWRYVQTDKDGTEWAFHGVFHGSPAPDGLVQTFEFEGLPGHIALESITFEERNGRTIARTHSVFQSNEDRDGMIESGMEEGMNAGYDQLDKLLARLRSNA